MKSSLLVALTIAWMAMIFYASSLPGSATGPDTVTFYLISKALHVVLFGILSMLFLIILKRGRSFLETSPAIFLLSLFLASIYAVSDEYHQAFTPGRYSSAKDVVIDTCGAITFLGAFYFFMKSRERKKGGSRFHGKTPDR
jgi:VanZ family protein